MFSIFHQIRFGNFFPPICLSKPTHLLVKQQQLNLFFNEPSRILCFCCYFYLCRIWNTKVLIRKPYPSFVVAIVVTLSGRIGLALPLWSSGKVNNNLESINVTNRENRARGKRNNSFSSSSLKITNQGTPAPGRKFTKQF